MFSLRLDEAIMTHVREFVKYKSAHLGHPSTVFFVTVKTTMYVDRDDYCDTHKIFVHFMFLKLFSSDLIIVDSQTSAGVDVPDWQNWRSGETSGLNECYTHVTHVLMEAHQEMRKALSLDDLHPVCAVGEIAKIHFRQIKSAETPRSDLFLKLTFAEDA